MATRPESAVENALDLIFYGPETIRALVKQRDELLAVVRRIGSGAESDPSGAAQRILYQMNDSTFGN